MFNVSLTYPDPIDGRLQFGLREANPNELLGFFERWDPTLIKLLDSAAHTKYWTLLQLPEDNRIWMYNKTEKTAIIGDAAHAMPPCLAQGASQSIEDGAFLGCLFPKNASKEEVTSRLKIFCERRRMRALAAKEKALQVGDILEMTDGPSQEERDSRMKNEADEGFPNPYAYPTVRQWLYTYDVEADVDAAVLHTNIRESV
ncbi:hypothetical protein NUW58_g1802 [Xylaria curta]|uniref:Uncharacterized protein n=1 Tax=Xylaria curta TaxID=42375 RepID=A0ACC1PIN8_9PEZI|nr:hypothetical protein NUW58_g1802 [Xylaria curta]